MPADKSQNDVLIEHPLLTKLRALASMGRPLTHADLNELEQVLSTRIDAQTVQDQNNELKHLRALCGCAYQLAGYHDAPKAWLDMLGDAAVGTPLKQWRQKGNPSKVLLPYAPGSGDAPKP